MKVLLLRTTCAVIVCQVLWAHAAAQQVRQPALTSAEGVAGTAVAKLPPQFVIGIGDVLSVTFWREQTLSGDVVVRPDGRISVPLLNDIDAAGFTPEQLAATVKSTAVKFVDEPDVTVTVKEIHSRKVFLVGQVATPGAVPLSTGDMNVLQLIAVGGGLLEFADRSNILIIRSENGHEKRFKFNYGQVLKGKNTAQNIVLQPGDTVVVR